MTIIEIRQDVERIRNLARSIRGLTKGDATQQRNALELFAETENLKSELGKFGEHETVNTAEFIGKDLKNIYNHAKEFILYPYSSEEVRKRVELMLKILNRIPAECVKKENPQITRAFKAGFAG